MSVHAEIASLESRLMQALDNEDRETFTDCWTADVDFEAVLFDGTVMKAGTREKLVELSTAHWTGRPSSLRHLVAAVWVEPVSVDEAKARFYCEYLNVGATPSLSGMGEYQDIVRRGNDGRWRVAIRRHLFLTPLNH